MTAAELLTEAGYQLTPQGWQVPGDSDPRVYLPADPVLAIRYARSLMRGRRLAVDDGERRAIDAWLVLASAVEQ